MSARVRRRIDVVLLGLGFAGARLHLPALARIPGVNVLGAADPDTERHPDAGGLRMWSDWQAALDAGPDAVVVATPPGTHAELASAALSRGLHTYLEKPMTTSLPEATDLAALAGAGDATLQLGYAYRFHPLWVRVRRLVTRGWLRPPLQAAGEFQVLGGGAGWGAPMIDVSCHHVDLVSSMLGAFPAEVSVESPTRLVVSWPDGSVLVGRYGTGRPTDRVELGDQAHRVIVDRLHGVRLVARGASLGPAGLPVAALLRGRRNGWDRSFEAALRVFVATISGDHGAAHAPSDVEPPGPETGLAMVATAEAVMASARTGRRQSVRWSTSPGA